MPLFRALPAIRTWRRKKQTRMSGMVNIQDQVSRRKDRNYRKTNQKRNTLKRWQHRKIAVMDVVNPVVVIVRIAVLLWGITHTVTFMERKERQPEM